MTRQLRVHLCAVMALLVQAWSAPAWGPHTEITAAALEVLPDGARWKGYLGDDWQRLARDYSWMADWQESVRPDHYADDYLLFPSAPTHVSHMLPDVKQTYAPFFRRALQAVRTESPRNAARWIGSLLHFVQDSGSPPHTIGIRGDLHGKMERWVDEKQVSIAGYEPRLLGKNDADALRGFRDRMDGLIEFARVRALKLKPLVEKLEERANQPLELECALETARVSADVVYTLLTTGLAEPVTLGCSLEGRIQAHPPAGYANVPARVIVKGTDYATTADADGHYVFRNLPPMLYTVLAQATGAEVEEVAGVELTAGGRRHLDIRLKEDRVPGNLLRNPAFQVRWIKPSEPDWWRRDAVKRDRWSSALVRVPLDRVCAVRVEFQPGKRAAVAVRWRANPGTTAGSLERGLAATPRDKGDVLTARVVPELLLKPFEKGVLFLEVLIATNGVPDEVCRHVAVTWTDTPREEQR